MYPCILTKHSFTIFAGDGPLTVHIDDERYGEIIKLYREETEEAHDRIIELMQPAKKLEKLVVQNRFNEAGIYIKDGMIHITGLAVDPAQTYTANQIYAFAEQNLPIQPLIEFYKRLRKNPSYRVRRDLLKFLEHGNLPITEDGCFMAYKRVNENFTDVFTGKMNYTPGSVVTMSRETVDDDPENTCSAGLHVCSYDYLRHFGGTTVISVKVDPADVVSIPTDYNNTKMRVCRLMSIDKIPEPEQSNVWNSPLVRDHDHDEDCDCDEDYDEECEDNEDDSITDEEVCGSCLVKVSPKDNYCHSCGSPL